MLLLIWSYYFIRTFTTATKTSTIYPNLATLCLSNVHIVINTIVGVCDSRDR